MCMKCVLLSPVYVATVKKEKVLPLVNNFVLLVGNDTIEEPVTYWAQNSVK